jgi:predicted MPP superfamily phosphohydrolase
MRIVHISDLHFTSDPELERLIAALCKDLSQVNRERKVDLVAFTGDLASKGRYSEKLYEIEYKGTIEKIKNALDPEISFIICPGNHDANIGRRESIYSAIFDLKEVEAANSLVRSALSGKIAPIWDHLSQYIELAKIIDPNAYASNPIVYTRKFTLSGLNIGVASLNSAWSTRGGGQGDHGRLFVGESQVDYAVKELAECNLRIALIHHPFEWLSPLEVGYIRRAVAANFHMLLCGHNHENNAASMVTNIGGLIVSNTGCVYQSREYFNGYSVLQYEESKPESIIINATNSIFRQDSQREGEWSFQASPTRLPYR